MEYRPVSIIERVSIPVIFGILFFVYSYVASATETLAAVQNPCLGCHADLNKPGTSVHAALKVGCETCHVAVKGKQHPEQKGSMTLIRDVPALCYGCHDRSKYRGKSVHPPVVIDTCSTCHDPHHSNFKALLITDIPALCFECHNGMKFKGKSVHQPVEKGMCLSCHKPHASNFANTLIEEPPGLCYACHDKKPFTQKYVHVVAAIPNGCSLCHTPHAGDNQDLLLQPVFELCTSCHSAEADGRHVLASMHLGVGESMHPVRGVPDPSDPSRDLVCISCHDPHSSPYPKLFVQKDLCLKCHKDY